MFAVALDNGLTTSGLAGIKLGQVNLKDDYIKVTGKGGKERIVPIGKCYHYPTKSQKVKSRELARFSPLVIPESKALTILGLLL
jgi:site-specific recombinase XerD